MYNVLVVDDEEDVRNLGKVILEAEGYHVDVASGGEEAEKLVREKRFDLLLLDVVMPHGDGLELFRKIRRDGRLRGIRVIMFSALGKGIQSMLTGEDQPDDYLEKPFDTKALVQKVNNLLKDTA